MWSPSMHHCTQALFALLLLLYTTLAKRGQRIEIDNQEGGDIKQPQEEASNVWLMLNALSSHSPFKWDRINTTDVLYGIPYVISGLYDSEELDIIWEAMRSIERNTCIRFEERKSEEDFLELQNKIHHGCYSGVGRMRGRNVMMLEANNMVTCIERDIVIHELMHTIGLWHEHMRADRDKYIRIRHENIVPRYRSEFDMVPEAESNTFGISYNYRSVMHYGKKAFSKRRGLITIETLDPAYQDVIGKVLDAAPSDYYKICAMYECNRCMGKPFNNVEPITQPSSFAATKLSTTLRRPVNAITINDQTFQSSNSNHNNNHLLKSIASTVNRLRITM